MRRRRELAVGVAGALAALFGIFGPAASAGTAAHGTRAHTATTRALVTPGTGTAGTGTAAPATATPPTPGSPVTVKAFATEPVVMTGADLPGWTSGPELTARAPEPPTDYDVYNSQGDLPAPLQSDCYQSGTGPDVNGGTDPYHGDHSCFQGSQMPVRTVLRGVPPQALLGYRWDGSHFVQIPFQVDTKWQHYLSNNASGFAFYSGIDAMDTYTFDQEPFRATSNPPFSSSDPTAVCEAVPPAGQPAATADPNPYLTDTDELAFMARDAGPQAPADARLPTDIVQAQQVRLVDPVSRVTRFVYVMESAMDHPGGSPLVAPAYTAANSPYVHYQPYRPFGPGTPDMFAYSQSNYGSYGNAATGPVCTVGADGVPRPVIGQGFKVVNGAVVLDPSTYVQRRSLDIATVSTPRYRFQYGDVAYTTVQNGSLVTAPLAGRWIMDGLSVSPDDKGLSAGDYGTSLVDRFKGRAFQQAPGGDTPCCGYEDEQVNWNGSSITMGIRQGPVRVIRVTWGSDSGTNVTRTDTFYAYSVDHEYNLRVHPIPPLDGIYTQWNMDAGAVTTYYNPYNPKGVPVTGINPVTYGDTSDFVGPSGIRYSSNDKLGRALAGANGGKPVTVGSPDPATCGSGVLPSVPVAGSPDLCVYGSFNTGDVTFGGPSPLASWEELTGPAGTTVDHWAADLSADPSAGGAQSLAEAVPYYVDDSCFDDGTGSSPGPQANPRAVDPTTWGFADIGGQPVAVSPAPAPAARYLGTVVDDGTTYVTDASGNSATASTDDTFNRRCWNHTAAGAPYNIPGTATYDARKPAHAPDPAPDPGFGPQGDVRYFEGDIATHGLHLLFTGDSDNAQLTTAVDEADSIDHQMVLPPNQANVGWLYAEQFTLPVTVLAQPFGVSSLSVPGVDVRGPGLVTTPVSGASGSGSSAPGGTKPLLPLPLP
jgi:hypothetical protein